MATKGRKEISIAVDGIQLVKNGYRLQVRAQVSWNGPWRCRYGPVGGSRNSGPPNGEAVFTLDLPSFGPWSRIHQKRIEELELEAKVQTLQFCEELAEQLKQFVVSSPHDPTSQKLYNQQPWETLGRLRFAQRYTSPRRVYHQETLGI
jgi:hypothetical protein